MKEWNDGYVFDIAYAGGVYREQTPYHLDAACLVAGVTPPVEPNERFTYCELGCGLGDTAIVVAASHPQASVWGFDFNPSHIAHGSARAARCGLDNLLLLERSFEDIAAAAPADMPPLDYVTLHGVWSWVSPANRAYIVEFLRKNLRPGGVVYVSYNAMPGWTAKIPLQHLMLEFGRRVGGSSEARIREGISLARRMLDVGGPALEEASLRRLERWLEDKRIPYLSHEYLNTHWAPAFFADVATALAPAKLSYVGSANILENFPQLCLKPEQHAFVETLPPEMRQTVQDYYCPRSFRRDLYMRGPRPLPARKRVERLRAQRLALAVPAEDVSREIDIPLGKATLNEAFYAKALATLGRGNASAGDLLEAAAPGTAPAPEDVVGMLIGGNQVFPASGEGNAGTLNRVRRFNRTQVAIALEEGEQGCWLAGAVSGAGLFVGVFDMLVFDVVSARVGDMSNDEIHSTVFENMKSRGMSMTLKNPEGDHLDALRVEVDNVVAEHIPIWRRIGAI